MVKSGTDIVYFSFFYYFCNENVTILIYIIIKT